MPVPADLSAPRGVSAPPTVAAVSCRRTLWALIWVEIRQHHEDLTKRWADLCHNPTCDELNRHARGAPSRPSRGYHRAEVWTTYGS